MFGNRYSSEEVTFNMWNSNETKLSLIGYSFQLTRVEKLDSREIWNERPDQREKTKRKHERLIVTGPMNHNLAEFHCCKQAREIARNP